MKSLIKYFSHLVLFVPFLMTSCASKDKTVGANLGRLEEVQLKNGLRVIYLPDNSLPRTAFQLMVLSGTTAEREDQMGINQLLADSFETGTTQKKIHEIAEELGLLGTTFNASADLEMTSFALETLSQDREQGLKLFSELILTPGFDQAQIERLKVQQLANIKKQFDRPETIAADGIDQAIFGESLYSRSTLGQVQTVKGLSRSDLMKHYFKYYRPNNAILAIVGKVDSDFKNKVKDTFEKWQRHDVDPIKVAELKEETPKVLVLDQPGMTQAQLRMGHLGIPRNHPDFLKARLANLILGGAFASRLNQRIRDELGLTYSVQSSLDTKQQGGAWLVSTFTRNEKVEQTLIETRKAISKWINEGVTDEEVVDAKTLLVGQFPLAIETSDKLANQLLLLRLYGVPDSYLQNFGQAVNAITKDQINEVIKKHFSEEKLKVVVVTDRKSLKGQLKGSQVLPWKKFLKTSASF